MSGSLHIYIPSIHHHHFSRSSLAFHFREIHTSTFPNISTNISTTHPKATQQVERIHRRHQRNGLGTHASVGDIRLQLHDDQNPKDLTSRRTKRPAAF